MEFDSLLKLMLDKKASDLFITRGVPPSLKINGKIMPVGKVPLSGRQARELVEAVMDDQQRAEFHAHHELNFAITSEHVEHARFRVSAFYQRNDVGMVLRLIETRIPTVEELLLPPILDELVMTKRGIIFLVGATGTGKSTTLAAMVDRINSERYDHIITVEDPIEYLHGHKKCLINQREVNADTTSFRAALRYVLRQDPDVVLIGEMRDLETIEAALTVAETGHLTLATLHTNSAVQTINRVIDVFPPHQQEQIRVQLSFVLEGILAQQLIPKKTGKGRVLAIELLIPNPAIRNLIREDKIHQIYGMMQTGQAKFGMQTMNQSLIELYSKGHLSYEDAIGRSPVPEELITMLQRLTNAPSGRGR